MQSKVHLQREKMHERTARRSRELGGGVAEADPSKVFSCAGVTDRVLLGGGGSILSPWEIRIEQNGSRGRRAKRSRSEKVD